MCSQVLGNLVLTVIYGDSMDVSFKGQVQCFSNLILRCCINRILTSVTIILAHLGILWTDGKIH